MYAIEVNKDFSILSEACQSNIAEIVFVTSGYLILEGNFNSIRVNRQEIHLSISHQTIQIDETSEDLKGWYCRIDIALIQNLFQKEDVKNEIEIISSFLYEYPLRLNPFLFERLSSAFDYQMKLLQEIPVDYPLVYSYLLVCIYEIKKLLKKSVPDFYPVKSFLIVKLYNDLLYRYINKEQNVGFYAKKLNLTTNHLNKSVKTVLGKTAIQLLNERRLLEAKSLLKYTDFSINEISEQLGFEDRSYFSRFFKKRTGIPPIDFRQLK